MKAKKIKYLSCGGLLVLAGLWTATGAKAQTAKSGQAPPTNCIAIASPTVQGASGNASEASTGVRELIASYLTGPSAKVIALAAKLPSLAREEASQKECEPVLFITVTRKTGGSHSFMRAFSQGAAASSWRLPGGSSTASAAATAGAAGGLQAASVMAASTKAKDELRLEYRLEAADGKIQFGPKTEVQTAKTDGEDLLVPVVARAAEAIITRKSAR
jgi:hypothetical protein